MRENKFIRIIGNSTETYLAIDAVAILVDQCALFTNEVFNDNAIGSGVYGNNIKDGTENGLTNPKSLFWQFPFESVPTSDPS